MINKETIKKENLELAKAMHTIIQACNNEEAYFRWIVGWIPDEPCEDDFEDLAEDEENMAEQCELFRSIIKQYGKDGFYTGGKVY